MFGQRPGAAPLSTAMPADPNELMRRMAQQTAMTYHWVRAGIVVIVLMLAIVILIG